MVGQWLANGWLIVGEWFANGYPMVVQWYATMLRLSGKICQCIWMMLQCLWGFLRMGKLRRELILAGVATRIYLTKMQAD